MDKEKLVSFGIGIGTGLLIGSILCILYAPKAGKETRQDIKDKTQELIQRVKELPADARAIFNKGTIEDVKGRK
jgi:gas vesicle protein